MDLFKVEFEIAKQTIQTYLNIVNCFINALFDRLENVEKWSIVPMAIRVLQEQNNKIRPIVTNTQFHTFNK